MKPDREIKNFFRATRPEVPDGEAFMAEFSRQSALLPQFAAFDGKEDLDKSDAIQYLAHLSVRLKRHNLSLAVVVILAVVAFSLLTAAAVFSIPDLDLPSLLADSRLHLDPGVLGKVEAMLPDWRLCLVSLLTVGVLCAVIHLLNGTVTGTGSDL